MTHYAQMGKNFQQFDYRNSKINKKNYDSKNPPEYNLAAISVPVHLYYGKNDPVTTEKVIFVVMTIFPAKIFWFSGR